MIKEDQQCHFCKYCKNVYDHTLGITRICKIIQQVAIDYGKFYDLIDDLDDTKECRICGNFRLLEYAREYECFAIGSPNDNLLEDIIKEKEDKLWNLKEK